MFAEATSTLLGDLERCKDDEVDEEEGVGAGRRRSEGISHAGTEGRGGEGRSCCGSSVFELR